MPMSAYVKPREALVVNCTKDIGWEICQIRSQISSDEIYKLAHNLLCQQTLQWPAALLKLQKGRSLNQLLEHLNLQVKVYGFSPENHLTLKGPFPTLSLRSMQSAVDEYRSTLRAVRCIEFLGNKAWNYSLKSAAKSVVPFEFNVAGLALEAFGYSTKQQIKIALLDLAERIKGCILNFLYDWENLLTLQVREQILTFKQNTYLPITETAV